ncbi:hypothetical protein EVU96_24745 [Bacillus infantis]|uniref:hypothetical protein n=1 Tax=Bacillus infantis TaxID=324767 RepID=UPI00101B72A1|nr:hypothetical protein [Bacillus infantis]RYI25177.1 hypothetical protein EVU96_24745 [Bacillus infantis]
MMATIEKGKMFGELTLSLLSKESLEELHTDNVLQQSMELIETKSGHTYTLDVHDLFVERKNAHSSNTVDVRLIVSLDVNDTGNDKEAFYYANSVLNEETISMKLFSLDTLISDTFFFLVTDLKINWFEFLSSDQA